MAYINYLDQEDIPPEQRVNDQDNIIQVHGVNPGVMKGHFDLYVHLMRRSGPLSFVQRELAAVVVSSVNQCHY